MTGTSANKRSRPASKRAPARAAKQARAPARAPSDTVESLRIAIEELRVAEEALREQNRKLEELRDSLQLETARYQQLFEQAPDAYLVTDSRGVIREANQAAAELLTIEREFLIGKPLSIYIAPEQVRDFRTKLREIEQHLFSTWETELRRRDNRILSVEANIAPMRDMRGNLIGLRWLLRNISQRRLAEQAIRQQAALINLTHEAILVRARDGAVIFWNEGAQELYGWTAYEVRGQATQQLLHTRSPIPFAEIDATLVQTGRWEGELVHTRRDGTTLIVASRQVLQRDEQGRPIAILEINSDITAQKHSEEALRTLNADLEERIAARTAELSASNERVVAILNSITDSYLALDAEGRLLDANPVAERYLFRRPKSDLLGQILWQAYPQGLDGEFYSHYVQAMTEQQPVHFEAHSELNGRWYETHAYPSPDRLDIYLRDITARKREEESRSRLAAIVESSNDAIIGLDLDGTVTSWNPSAEHLFGYPAQEAIGRPISIIYPPEREPELPDLIARVRLGERIEHFETVRVRKDGQPLSISVSISPIRDAAGKLIGAAKIERDITAEKRSRAAERFLSEASAALAGSLDFETTLDRVARLTIPFLADYCVVEIEAEGQNPRQVTIAASAPDKEQLLRELVQHLLLAQPDSVFDRVVKTGRPEIVRLVPDSIFKRIDDAELRHALQRLAPHSYMLLPLVARKRSIGVLSLAMSESRRLYDDTDLAIAQDLAQRAALAVDNARLYFEAQAAIVARDQFLAVASHEVRTPLTIIQGYTQLLRRQSKGTDQEANSLVPLDRARLIRSLDNIEYAASRLSTLISDLLDVSHMRDRALHVTPERVNLNELLRQVIANAPGHLDHREQTRSVDFRLDLPDQPIWGNWDRGRLEQIMVNLVDNAIKYSPVGGIIWIRLAVEPDGAHEVHFSIRDEGIGIPPEEMGKMFQPFVRTSNATQRHYPGLGLGLAVSREIVTRHGGRIWAESPGLDQGATFHIVLPGVIPQDHNPP